VGREGMRRQSGAPHSLSWQQSAPVRSNLVTVYGSLNAILLSSCLANMTIYDYHVTMKRVRIADLKANLSRHLHYVRRGHVLTVLDRETAVAQLVPYQQAETLRVRQPLGRHRSPHQVPLPPPLPLDVDLLELLREERQPER